MRKRFALAVIALLLGLAAGGYYFFGKVDEVTVMDEVTVLYGRVDVKMNYTSDYPPDIRENVLGTPHCGYHLLQKGELKVYAEDWDEDITTVIMLNFGGDHRYYDGMGGGEWVRYLTSSDTLEVPAALNTTLALYRLKPATTDYLEPIAPMVENNGTWNITYEVHSGNQTYQVTESLTLEIYTRVPVILKRPYGCD